MKTFLSLIFAMILFFAISQFTYLHEVQTNGKICGNPSATCLYSKRKFSAEDLSFNLPQTTKWQTIYYSANFYAINLKSRKAIPAENIDD